eukprot:11419929-Karenia_brevis.AAC.1
MMCQDGSVNEDALLRTKSATAAYAPIAGVVFSSPRISLDLKLSFAESLVFSRLFYNVHTWIANNTFALKKLSQ